MATKVMIAMSGGVDSSGAALMLMDKGFELAGATLKLFDFCSFDPENCGSSKDIDDAKRIAQKLRFPHYVFDLSKEFSHYVIKDFVDSYVNGFTPNPCVECNKHIKFDGLMKIAEDYGYDFLATGHYAKTEYDSVSKRYILKKADDLTKDQSYVLYGLNQRQLSKTIFPLGNITKARIREMAMSKGFCNASKPDSQDICFIKDGDYGNFINQNTKTHGTGNMVDVNGNKLAEHRGVEYYTIGQRKGLGVSFGKPQFVIEKNAKKNEVVVGDEEYLFKNRLEAYDVNLIAFESLEKPLKICAKTRYKQVEQPATLFPSENGQVIVEFDKPQRAITPGQSVVFYDGDIVIGGGKIK